MNPLSFLLVCLAGWMNRRQQAVIEYLQEEVRVSKNNWANVLVSPMTSAEGWLSKASRWVGRDFYMGPSSDIRELSVGWL